MICPRCDSLEESSAVTLVDEREVRIGHLGWLDMHGPGCVLQSVYFCSRGHRWTVSEEADVVHVARAGATGARNNGDGSA